MLFDVAIALFVAWEVVSVTVTALAVVALAGRTIFAAAAAARHVQQKNGE